jgi:hypothetical protein
MDGATTDSSQLGCSRRGGDRTTRGLARALPGVTAPRDSSWCGELQVRGCAEGREVFHLTTLGFEGERNESLTELGASSKEALANYLRDERSHA